LPTATLARRSVAPLLRTAGRCRNGRAAALSRRGPRQLHLPGGAGDHTSPRPSVSLTRYEQPDCPRSLSACKHPNPDAVRKRSQAHRPGAGDAHSGSRRPGRRAAPSSKGIVTSAATARALCHVSGSRAGQAVVTAGDRRIVRSAQPAAADQRPAVRLVALPQGTISTTNQTSRRRPPPPFPSSSRPGATLRPPQACAAPGEAAANGQDAPTTGAG
jgi:hypothetical protein